MCSKTSALKQRHYMLLLIADGNMIEPGAFAIMDFFGLGGKYISYMHGFGKVDGSVQGYGKYISIVAGKCKATIGQRKSNAAMYNAKAVNHFGAYGHLYFTVAFFYLQYGYPQPLAKKIVLHHVVYHLLCGMVCIHGNLFSGEDGWSFLEEGVNAFAVIGGGCGFALQFIFQQ